MKKPTQTKTKGFIVMNHTDGITASPDTFLSLAKANLFIKNFRKRFKAQSYYRTNRMEKLAPEDIDLEVFPASDAIFIGETAIGVRSR